LDIAAAGFFWAEMLDALPIAKPTLSKQLKNNYLNSINEIVCQSLTAGFYSANVVWSSYLFC